MMIDGYHKILECVPMEVVRYNEELAGTSVNET